MDPFKNFTTLFTGQFGELLYKGYPFTPFPLKRTIVFEIPFEEEPAFMYAIKMLDLNYAENTRAAVELKNLTNHEFTLEMKTIHDTQMYGLGVTWMACPSVWYSWCVDTRIPQSLIPIIFHFNFLKLPDSFCHVVKIGPERISFVLTLKNSSKMEAV